MQDVRIGVCNRTLSRLPRDMYACSGRASLAGYYKIFVGANHFGARRGRCEQLGRLLVGVDGATAALEMVSSMGGEVYWCTRMGLWAHQLSSSAVPSPDGGREKGSQERACR